MSTKTMPAAARETGSALPESRSAVPDGGLAGAADGLDDAQLDGVAGGTLRTVVRPVLPASPAFMPLPEGERQPIATGLAGADEP